LNRYLPRLVLRSWREETRRRLHRLEMRVAPLVELLVSVAHGLGFAAPQHDLEIDGLETVVLVAVDHTGRARDAFPWAQAGGGALATFVVDKHRDVALEPEEAHL